MFVLFYGHGKTREWCFFWTNFDVICNRSCNLWTDDTRQFSSWSELLCRIAILPFRCRIVLNLTYPYTATSDWIPLHKGRNGSSNRADMYQQHHIMWWRKYLVVIVAASTCDSLTVNGQWTSWRVNRRSHPSVRLNLQGRWVKRVFHDCVSLFEWQVKVWRQRGCHVGYVAKNEAFAASRVSSSRNQWFLLTLCTLCPVVIEETHQHYSTSPRRINGRIEVLVGNCARNKVGTNLSKAMVARPNGQSHSIFGFTKKLRYYRATLFIPTRNPRHRDRISKSKATSHPCRHFYWLWTRGSAWGSVHQEFHRFSCPGF